ncbi:hypothetical protein PPL_06776 [Heterostelium album PN500]|uniref:Uncharacterized protein n=1 Tax=Heterostelium pallidum (strain ATCC 26659 / Pp 5 / PN500) TaxID=670386 RepID=D3BFP1_HETP5|nr:hypothetical protein PPL_06776 [Heterostelium album PN500]EFA79955.1 hypothetical protein PPL_06776 [Heterostelium album PN500]|eukprot:XP_020432075.1 hypothetical protein PPL_06776 [Heterostelium album PN500]
MIPSDKVKDKENVIGQKRTHEDLLLDESLSSQQLKKIDSTKSDDNNQTDKNNIIESLHSTFNFKDFNTLTNFIGIYDLYFRCSHSDSTESVREQCVGFFANYHNDSKYSHYFDVRGFTKFIAEVFFDPSDDVFDALKVLTAEFKLFNTGVVKPTYQAIIDDKRFKEWFINLNESNINLLKFKIARLEGLFEPEQEYKLNFFTYEKLYDIVHPVNAKLSDIMLDNIIAYIISTNNVFVNFKNLTNESPKIIKGKHLLHYALVSKQFFKAIAKATNTRLVSWTGYLNFNFDNNNNNNLKNNNNNNNEYSLFRLPPMYFDYESIKYIPYDKGVDHINRFFSRVETFTVKSDEFDHSVDTFCYSDTTDPDVSVARESVYKNSFNDHETIEEQYRQSMVEDGYLVYPPVMQNLKEIYVYQYHGYKVNYDKLLSHIIQGTPSGNGHGIERFTMEVKKNFEGRPSTIYFDFIRTLVKLHSTTLKSIRLLYPKKKFNDSDYRNLDGLLKTILPKLNDHGIKFSWNIKLDQKKFQKVKRSEDVFQFLLQISEFNE